MNFNWKKDIYSDRYSTGDRPPGISQSYVEYVLPWGFKIVGIAIALFPIVYKVNEYLIHSKYLSSLVLSDQLLLFIILVGLSIEVKSESKKYVKETSKRRLSTLLLIVITAFVYFHHCIEIFWDMLW